MKLKTASDYQAGRIVATDLVKNDNGQATLMAFDEGSTIATHKAPGDALVQVIEGDVVFVVEGEKRELTEGDYFTMSVGTQHEVYAVTRSKVLLTLIKTDVCGCTEKDKAQAEELLPEA
ncbi:MAG: cupin domain-containing protein [Muribaculaceae bacterium]|nr:cupin domain-containing protein [Muribaculaceae bacterium]